jgi:hypothetical protein
MGESGRVIICTGQPRATIQLAKRTVLSSKPPQLPDKHSREMGNRAPGITALQPAEAVALMVRK